MSVYAFFRFPFSTSQEWKRFSISKRNCLIVFRQVIAVYSENILNTLRKQNVIFSCVSASGSLHTFHVVFLKVYNTWRQYNFVVVIIKKSDYIYI
jgi:hypothetical protein